MAENKTHATKAGVGTFVATIVDDARRRDAKALVVFLRKVTGEKPRMWGPRSLGLAVTITSTAAVPKGICLLSGSRLVKPRLFYME